MVKKPDDHFQIIRLFVFKPRQNECLGRRGGLFQLGLFVFNVLASFGIKLHDRHFLGHGFFVFAGGVEVTGSSC